MSFNFGEKIKIQIFGQSHSQNVGVVIDGLPAGFEIDFDRVDAFLKRRQGGKNHTTQRKEDDAPKIVSGIFEGKTCGAPLTAIFENNDCRSEDYSKILNIPRPSHVDYFAKIKYEGNADYRGGGQFSGRLTLPLCFAGAVCLQILEARGVKIQSHILSIGGTKDKKYTLDYFCEDAKTIIERVSSLDGNIDVDKELKLSKHDVEFPLVDPSVKEKMLEEIFKYREQGDSIGGSIECAIMGIPVGIGEPMFDGVENKISTAIFAIPGIKGIEFGAGFEVCSMSGSENNDTYRYEDGKVVIESNNAGGIVGGISTGMPIIFRVAVKPTATISKAQNSINIIDKRNETIETKGRHDPCIVPRAVPCVEAAAAIAILNLM